MAKAVVSEMIEVVNNEMGSDLNSDLHRDINSERKVPMRIAFPAKT